MPISRSSLLRSFYLENREAMFRYALSLTGKAPAAEDVVHGVMAALLALETLPSQLRPYAFRSIRNAALNLRRSRENAAGDYLRPEPVEAPQTAFALREDLQQALDRLAPCEREVVVLKVYQGYSFREIAECLDTPLNTVASWYRRGLGRLRSDLEKLYHE